MSTYAYYYKWQSHTSLKHSEIPWLDAGYQAALEGTRQEKMRRAWTKKQENVLAHRKKIGLLIHNQLIMYKQYWSLCGPAACSCGDARNRATLTSFNNFKTRYFRNIIDAPWYIRNVGLHRDLQMETVTNEIGEFAKRHEARLLHHVKVKAIQMLNNSELVWKLKRKNLLSWCSDN